MQIILNGQRRQFEKVDTLAEILVSQGYQLSAIAVAVDQTIIAPHQYSSIKLYEGIEIEIVTPMQGG
jgi:sulfur carrier protein